MKQTAVEWLREVYNQQGMILKAQFDQAKEMEKEQMIDMLVENDEFWGMHVKQKSIDFVNRYFKETYGGEQ